MRFVVPMFAFACALAAGPVTHAQPAPEVPAPAGPTEPTTARAEPEPEPEPDRPPDEPSLREALQQLQDDNAELREELELLKEDQQHVETRVTALAPLAAKLTGYLDLGAFAVTGDGSGIRSDIGHRRFPEYQLAGVPDSWVFMGDPLSTMVNARGDPATTGESRAIVFDAIGARKSTFLVNNLNLGLFAPLGERAIVTAKLDVVPRGRDISGPDGNFLGDYVDLRLAYVEYRIAKGWGKVDLFAGKFDSVLGFEYRSQEAPTRIEVTPSLICRYTCGYPIGVKARVRLASDALVANVAVTNGSHSSEGFPFHRETDTQHNKTVAGRLSYSLPAIRELELGVSGMFGAQDGQLREDIYQWMYGVDIHLHRQDLVIRGEFVHGRAPGETDPGSAARCGLTPCLEFKGAYGLAGYRITNVVMPYLRVDWRQALHEAGVSFVYISELWRATPGIRLAITDQVIFKAEYTVNRELGRIPQFANDVFTSSLVVKY